MMTQEVIFDRVKQILGQLLPGQLREFEGENGFAIADSGIWVKADEAELTFGYGLNHRHYNPKYDNMREAIDDLFNLLTNTRKSTLYYKGGFIYKDVLHLKSQDGLYTKFSTSTTWLYPYWKKTRKAVTFSHGIIDRKDVDEKIVEIKNYAQQVT